MTQSWYHIVVLGTDLAGLIYAALAARVGYRVLVIGQGERPNAYKVQGHYFLRQPEHLFGFGSSKAVQRVFGELSMGMEMKNRPQPVSALQIATPRMRLELGGLRRAWERECERELPGQLPFLDALDEWADELTRVGDEAFGVEDGEMHRAPLATNPLAEPLPPDLRVVLDGSLNHLSRVLMEPGAPLVNARLWHHLRAGLYRFPGGMDGLKQFFVRKIRDQASDVRLDAVVEHIVLKRGKVVALELAGRGEAVGCEQCVVNIDPRKLADLFNPDEREEQWHRALAMNQPTCWQMMVNLAVEPRVLPAAMGPELVWVHDIRGRLRGDNCLWISRPGVGPHALGDQRPGPGVLCVTSLYEARTLIPSQEGIQRAVSHIMDSLRRLIPWLDAHLKLVDVPALKGSEEQKGVDLDALVPVYARAESDSLGASAFRGDTPYKGLLVASDSRFGALGFEGACLTALHTLHRTRAKVKLHRNWRERFFR